MINIATVHFADPKWIDPQLRALDEHLIGPYRVFTNLEGIDSRDHDGRFHYVTRTGGPHWQKLNDLAEEVALQSADEDRIVFLDGDALPIRALDPWMDSLLAHHRLAAIQRLENAGDIQPHPSFCVTTVGLWNEVKGDWRPGPTWTNAQGVACSDVGATLMVSLEQHGVPWLPILRSNRRNLHPLLFGIYGGHIYHHGAGFRKPLTRVDGSRDFVAYRRLRKRVKLTALPRLRPRHAHMVVELLSKRRAANKVTSAARDWQVESDRIFAELCRDPGFFEQFEAA